jgi:transcription-repair coupling factor (superfamily II helicase)
VVRGAEDPLARLKASTSAATPHRVLVIAESDGRRESLLDFLRASGVSPPAFDSLAEFEASDEKIGIATAALASGFAWREQGIDLVTETELFATAPTTRRRNKKQEQVSDVEALIKDLSELNVGDPVVHTAHGIGRYRGLITWTWARAWTPRQAAAAGNAAPGIRRQGHALRAGQPAAPDQPLHRRQRRRSAAAQAGLRPVGKGQAQGRRTGARLGRRTAEHLRPPRRARRPCLPLLAADYEVFANDFGFEETADQNAAIHAVIQDMISPQPMDRLVCGDVGFGKTEVALRAAFIAVTGGKQVAFLAPTTLLAEQHYQTLVDRFAKWPVKVAEMSRFRSGQGNHAAAKGLADGSVDIVVGTHKLLSQSIKFKNLGLLIIDEEHRFGVRHKEAMKAMRAEVDVLTLTATPIPRTLGMALEGLRDLSVIATAPQRRLAIKTFVRNEGNGVIREAVLRELKRGGQVYFLHNEVETIENRRQKLEEMLARGAHRRGPRPDARARAGTRDARLRGSSATTCCCARPSSRPASTCPPPTPS